MSGFDSFAPEQDPAASHQPVPSAKLEEPGKGTSGRAGPTRRQ